MTGGNLESSTVLGHPGIGGVNCVTVSNTWILNNMLGGLDSPGMVERSGIRNNADSGIKNAGSVNSSILFGNGGDSGFDYEESRSSNDIIEVDVSGNFWGPNTTAFMNANPWGSGANVPKIFDFFDDTNRTLANYDNHLTSDPGLAAGPDLSPPAFLLSATPNLSNAVGVGLTEFTLVFNEPMETSVEPVVTFDTMDPFTGHVVEPMGWSSTTSPSATWRGTFATGIETGDGLNTIRVSGAKAADGFSIPDDTSHRFFIDTAAGTSAVRGFATPLGSTEIALEWEPSNDPNLASYSIRRALSPRGPYDRVANTPPSATEAIDTGLIPGTVYYYQVVEIDSAFNSRQLTSPFSASTDSLSPTPTATIKYDVGPGGMPDGSVDSRDLLPILSGLEAENDDWRTLFDFSLYWGKEDNR